MAADRPAAPRRYLNLNAKAWRQLHHAWHPRPSLPVLTQRWVVAPFLSGLESLQQTVAGKAACAPPPDCIVILGYWRSGTTLLHNYLALDERYAFPDTFSCMNPHHFLLSPPDNRLDTAEKRPMDEVIVSPGSPQEDEFALLGLGARSPYEALLFPDKLEECLRLANPAALTPRERSDWTAIFLRFVINVSARRDGRPLILKSPPHGQRVALLRELLPHARFVLITRDPNAVFESCLRLWKSLFALYGLTPPPSDDDIREAVIADRLRFEQTLQPALRALPGNRIAEVRYEDLAETPLTVLKSLYAKLALGDFSAQANRFAAAAQAWSSITPHNQVAPSHWQSRLARDWQPIFARYGFPSPIAPS